jgi:hypothetical protein
MRADGPRETPRVTDPGAESVPLVGSHGSGHARTSPSGGSAALCAPACHGKGQGRRISPRMGVRVTDSGPKASPSQGPAAAEDWACRGAPRGRSCTPREAPKGKLRATECSKGEVARHERRRGEGAAPVARQHRPPREVPRHFARRQAVESTKGDVFRHGRGRG